MKKEKEIVEGIWLAIITVILMVVILPKVDETSRNLSIIAGCVCVMTMAGFFLSNKMGKVLEKGLAILLIPNFIMFIAEFRPEVLQINIIYLYLFVISNILLSILSDRIFESLVWKGARALKMIIVSIIGGMIINF